jgi:hypothetical protein
MAAYNFNRFAVLFLILAASLSCFAQNTCTAPQTFKINNHWSSGDTVPYGMVAEVFNPAGSGCDLYIVGYTVSVGLPKEIPYAEFGAAFATAVMPGCTSMESRSTNLLDLSPFPLVTMGLPCGPYISIGTTSDARWVIRSGEPYEESFGGKPQLIPQGMGYSLWSAIPAYTDTAGHQVPRYTSWAGDLTITLTVETLPAGSLVTLNRQQ